MTAPATSDTPAQPVPQLSHRRVLSIFSGLMLGMLLAALDQTIVATALPTITRDLGGLEVLSWVVTAYLLAATVSTPLYGKLGDLFGRKLLFQVSIGIFLVGSVLCGLSQSMMQLVAFRALQGLGAGGLMVLAQAIMAEVVPPRERGRYAGWFGALFGVASVAGPLLGGFLTDNLSWRWVFYVNVPVGVVAMIVTAAKVPTSSRHGSPKVDYVGAALLAIAVSCIVLVTTLGGTTIAWGSPQAIGLAIAAVVLLGILVVYEARVPEPIVPVQLFRSRTFDVASAVSFILGVAMFGALSYLPLFQQVVNRASATDSGLLLLPLMLGLLGASVVSGQIITRTGRYRLFPVSGTALTAVAMFLLSTMAAHTSSSTVTAYMALLGVGIGLTMQTLVLAVQNAVKPTELGVATSSVTFFRSMGGSIGVAVFGALFNNQLAHRLGSSVISRGSTELDPSVVWDLPPDARDRVIGGFAASLTTVFLWATPMLVVALGLTLLLREIPLRSTTHTVDHAREMSAASAPGAADPEVEAEVFVAEL